VGKGGGGSSGTQQVVNSTEIPPYIADRLKTGLALGEDAIGSYDANKNFNLDPYQAYSGNRIAGFAPDERQAFDATRSSIGAYNPFIEQATGYAQQGAKGYDAGLKSQFANSYASNVTDEMARLSNKNLLENVLPGVNDTFIKGGTFGGTRNTDFTLRAIDEEGRRLSGQQAEYLSNNENNANSQMADALGRASAGGTQLANLGNQLQSQQGIDLLRMGTIGQQERNMNQRGLDQSYDDFVNQRDYQKNQADWLLGLARGTNDSSKTETKTESKPNANPYSQLAGIAAGASQFAEGGRVKRKKKKTTKKMVKKSAPKKKFKRKG
jgi:hypothetical protein